MAGRGGDPRIHAVQSEDSHPRAGAIVPGLAGRPDPVHADGFAAPPQPQTQFPRPLDRKARQHDDEKIGDQNC
jgi:hypothetical protein